MKGFSFLYFVDVGSLKCISLSFLESCLLTKERRLATVQTQTTCQLFSLSVDRFHRVLQDYPEIKKDMESSQQDKDLLIL